MNKQRKKDIQRKKFNNIVNNFRFYFTIVIIGISVLLFTFLCFYVFTYGAIFNGNPNLNTIIGNISLIVVAVSLLSLLVWDIRRRKNRSQVMNAQRRKDIEKAVELLYEAKSMLETSLEEEQNAFDNLPEGIQCSERGEKMEEYIGYLEDAISSIDDSIENAKYCYN